MSTEGSKYSANIKYNILSKYPYHKVPDRKKMVSTGFESIEKSVMLSGYFTKNFSKF